MGVKPFYYSLGALDICVRNWSIRTPLLAHPSVPREVDAQRVYNYLVKYIDEKERTFYRAIRRLPAAHAMIVQEGGASLLGVLGAGPRAGVPHRARGRVR